MQRFVGPHSQIRESRKLLGNPYAHLNGDGEFDALMGASQSRRFRSRKDQIKRAVTNLQNEMWRNRRSIWPHNTPTQPRDILDPIAALEFLGYKCHILDSLVQFSPNGRNSTVAGYIDKPNMIVAISGAFPTATQRFTAAHELIHALEHDAIGLHRDRPLDGGAASPTDSIEHEANLGAAYFLMPDKLLISEFSIRFGTTQLSLNEGAPALFDECSSLRDFSRAVAGTGTFGGNHFDSLASVFGVSNEAMAIRLEDLQLLCI